MLNAVGKWRYQSRLCLLQNLKFGPELSMLNINLNFYYREFKKFGNTKELFITFELLYEPCCLIMPRAEILKSFKVSIEY